MRIKTLIAALTLLPVMSFGQFDFGGGQTNNKPWTEFKLNPKTRVSLNFPNASVDAIISLLSKTSGITIVKDPSLTGNLRMVSAKPVTLADAFQILSSTLSLKNFELRKEGNLLVIKAKQQNNGRGRDTPPIDFSQMPQRSESELKVYYINYANASQVARVINDVFASSSTPQINFGNFGGGGGRGGGGGNQRQRFNPAALFGQQPTVKASSDDFSNSVIVNAPSNLQNQVADLIGKLDKQTDQPQQAKVYKLEFADATDLAPTVQNVLTSNAPKGKGGISAQNVPIEQRFQQAFRFGSSSAAFGTVVADERTNSLIVTATEENQQLVSKVIAELDTEVKVENTTFVFPLNNARAEDIASLLQQAFGTRTGLTGGGGRVNNNRNTGSNRNFSNNNNRNNRNNNGRNGGGLQGNVTQDGSAMTLALQDPNADSGELETNVAVAQGGGFGQIFGQRRGGGGGSNSGSSTQARDASGRLVNIRDLQNQITVIPDPNTNSLIIVTNPENIQLIQSILDQLDKIPEQVMIETMIIEASLDSSSQFGVEWKYAQSKAFGNPAATGTVDNNFGLGNSTTPPQGFRYSLTGGDLQVFLNALKSDTKFQVLSTPRIFTSNNEQAEINISQSVPYVVSSREDANGNLSYQYTFTDVGIVLNVTPHISANGTVTLEVDQTANDLQGYTDFNAPIINRREANTVVSVQDGQSIILGGIIRNQVTSTVKKIPLLGDIPLLGQLFRSTSKGNNRTELMVFLTPHIVHNPEDAQGLRRDTERKLTPNSQKEIEKTRTLPPPVKTDNKEKSGGH